MKKALLLLAMLAIAGSTLAQTAPPKPLKPTVDDLIDGQPIIFRDTITDEPVEYVTNTQMMFQIGMDVMQRPVANDYPGLMGDEALTGELTYTLLEPENVSWSIFTDNNKLFVFTPEDYPDDFVEPVTEIPFGYEGRQIEYWFVHFPGKTNNIGPLLEAGWAVEPFFKYRIGIQSYNTVDGVRTASDIGWYWIKYDINGDGEVDVADVNLLINMLLGKEEPNSRAYITEGDTEIDVSDINELINIVLDKLP